MERDACAGEGQSPIYNPSATSQALQHILANATQKVVAERTSHSLEYRVIDQQKLLFKNCLQARARKKILRKLKHH